MSALAWLAIPAVAVLLSVLWVAWVTRTKPPIDIRESLQEHERFKAAFDRRSSAAGDGRVPDRRSGGDRRRRRAGS
jgi:hypothetical protein